MTVSEQMKSLSPEDFAMMGAPRVAYVKQVDVDGEAAYSIHSANGSPLGMAPDRDTAFSVAIQHDLDPVHVH
jgi:hypothetical protein